MKTSIFRELNEMARVVSLIKRRGTGTTEELAQKLCISKRSAERLISHLKEEGFPIAYCSDGKTYYYEGEV